jgi:hypothetical protein
MACCASGFLTFFTPCRRRAKRALSRSISESAVEKIGEGNFCCSVIALSGSALPGKSLLIIACRVPHRISCLVQKFEHRIRYIALFMQQDCE